MNNKIANFLVDHRLIMALLSILLLVGTTMGMKGLFFEGDYKIFFADDDPQLVAHEAIEAEYTKTDNIFIMLAPANGTVFSKEALEVVEWVTNEGWLFPAAIRVDSLTNYQHTIGQEDDLIVAPLVEDASALTESDLARIRQIALNEKTLVHQTISEQGHVTAVNIRLEMPSDRAERDLLTPKIVERGREIAAKIKAEHPGWQVHLMGLVVTDHTFNEMAAKDAVTLVPIMFVIVLVLLLAFLRSVLATLVTLIIIITSVASALGIQGWIGYSVNQISVSAPTIIMTLAICDSVHILVTYLQRLNDGDDRLAAMKQALDLNLQPVFLTSLTTAIGFLSLNFSDSPLFQALGNIAAVGVMTAWLFSILLLPALTIVMPIKVRLRAERTSGNGLRARMEQLADFTIAKKTPLFWGFILITALILTGIPRNELNDNTVGYFDPGVPFRDAADFMQENLTGFDGISYSLNSGKQGGVNDPEYLAKVDAFAQWYLAQPEVVYVNVYTDILKRLNKNLHGDDPAWYRIPETRDLAAQYQLLYEFSLPQGLDLNAQVNFDKSALVLFASVKGQKAQGLIDLDLRAQDWLRANAPDLVTPGSSVSVMFAHIGQNNINSMMIGTPIALALIALTLMIALKSLKFGLLSLIPNAFPCAITFGLWGYYNGEVNLAVAAVFSITLGIVVDDTVHFLSKYLRARRDLGKDTEAAIRYAFSTVGAALLVTTAALALGFFVLAQSQFNVNGSMGLLVTITIIVALIYDLLFLPTVLMKVDRDKAVAPS